MKFGLTLCLNTLGGTSYGYFISSAVTDGTTALMLSPVLAMPLMLVGGFFANSGGLPIYLTVFSHISPIMYSFHNMAKLEFTNSPYPEAENFLEFLGIEREFETGILYLVILILSCQVLAVIFLKVLISKFQ